MDRLRRRRRIWILEELEFRGISVVGENGNVSFYEDYRGGYCDFDDNFYVSNFIFIKELLSEI